VSAEVYLGTVEDRSLWATAEQTLVLFLEDGTIPPNRLLDPEVIGQRPATGTWLLLHWEARTRRAFYEEYRPGRMPESDAARYLDDGLAAE
jgi:hypothetical protein